MCQLHGIIYTAVAATRVAWGSATASHTGPVRPARSSPRPARSCWSAARSARRPGCSRAPPAPRPSACATCPGRQQGGGDPCEGMPWAGGPAARGCPSVQHRRAGRSPVDDVVDVIQRGLRQGVVLRTRAAAGAWRAGRESRASRCSCARHAAAAAHAHARPQRVPRHHAAMHGRTAPLSPLPPTSSVGAPLSRSKGSTGSSSRMPTRDALLRGCECGREPPCRLCRPLLPRSRACPCP